MQYTKEGDVQRLLNLGITILAFAVIISVPLSSLLAQKPPKSTTSELAASVTISRDEFGVPHVFGRTDVSVAFGFAYAQAEDNFLHLEDNYIRAIGRSSEVYGEKGLSEDRIVRALEIPRVSEEEYRKSRPSMRALYDAFAAGLDFFLKTHPNVKPALLDHFEPWYPLALLRYKYYVLEFFWYAGLQPDSLRITIAEHKIDRKEGSNAWAVAPGKSADGHALLFQNPHIGFFGPAQYYEGHLHSDEGWNFSGAARYGFPFPYLGHNEHLGWSYTDNEIDNGDLYVETFDDPSHPLAYRYGKEYRFAKEWTERVSVKTANGIELRELTFRKTHHGPLVSELNGKPVSVRLAKLAEGGWYDQWYEMTKAKSLLQFKDALRQIAVPYMNITYADRDGNIFYCYYGSVPRRSADFDWRKPVDGANPKTEWNGFHAFEELPQVLNPPSGFVQNCNSSPFFTTSIGNPDSTKFPSYMIGRDEYTPRARVSRQVLSEKDKFTFEEWLHAATDTRVFEAGGFIRALITEYDTLRQIDIQRADQLGALIAELKSWDRISRRESSAMTLFTLSFAQQWFQSSSSIDVTQNRWPHIRALETVRTYLVNSWGTWKVPWGEINRLQRTRWSGEELFDDQKPSLAVSGGPGDIGIVFNFYWPGNEYNLEKALNRKRRYGIAGNSYVAVVDFGSTIKAYSIVYFGQSGDPSSPHYFDQAPLYAEGKFKPAWFSRQEVIEHSVLTYHPGEKPGK